MNSLNDGKPQRNSQHDWLLHTSRGLLVVRCFSRLLEMLKSANKPSECSSSPLVLRHDSGFDEGLLCPSLPLSAFRCSLSGFLLSCSFLTFFFDSVFRDGGEQDTRNRGVQRVTVRRAEKVSEWANLWRRGWNKKRQERRKEQGRRS